jgi:hypothetical protein
MNPTPLSRRGFLGSLTACLCPRAPQASVAPGSSVALPPREDACCISYSYGNMGQRCTTYEYDGRGRLVRVTEHPPSAAFPYKSGAL